MALCVDPAASIVAGSGIVITGSGTPGNPWLISTTSPVDITDIQDDIAAIEAALLTIPATYVNVSGDYMTGLLTVESSGASIHLRRTGSDSPFIDFYDSTGATQLGFIQASTGLILNSAASDIIFRPVGVERARVLSTGIAVSKTALDLGATTGIDLYGSGSVYTSRPDTSANFVANKTSTGSTASGTVFCQWQVAGVGTIGSISRNTTTNAVLYNVSSDQDLKENFESVDDDLALLWLRLIEPQFFTYKGHPDVIQVGYAAQKAMALWPNAAQHGVI